MSDSDIDDAALYDATAADEADDLDYDDEDIDNGDNDYGTTPPRPGRKSKPVGQQKRKTFADADAEESDSDATFKSDDFVEDEEDDDDGLEEEILDTDEDEIIQKGKAARKAKNEDKQSEASAKIEQRAMAKPAPAKPAAAAAAATPTPKSKPKSNTAKSQKPPGDDAGTELTALYLQRVGESGLREVQCEVLSQGAGENFPEMSQLTMKELAKIMLFNENPKASPGHKYTFKEIVFGTITVDEKDNVILEQLTTDQEQAVRKQSYPENNAPTFSQLRKLQTNWMDHFGAVKEPGGRNEGIYEIVDVHTLGHPWICIASTLYMDKKAKASKKSAASTTTPKSSETVPKQDTETEKQKTPTPPPKKLLGLSSKKPASTPQQAVIKELMKRRPAVADKVKADTKPAPQPEAATKPVRKSPAPQPEASTTPARKSPAPKKLTMKRKVEDTKDVDTTTKKSRVVEQTAASSSPAVFQCTYSYTGTAKDLERFNLLMGKVFSTMAEPK